MAELSLKESANAWFSSPPVEGLLLRVEADAQTSGIGNQPFAECAVAMRKVPRESESYDHCGLRRPQTPEIATGQQQESSPDAVMTGCTPDKSDSPERRAQIPSLAKCGAFSFCLGELKSPHPVPMRCRQSRIAHRGNPNARAQTTPQTLLLLSQGLPPAPYTD